MSDSPYRNLPPGTRILAAMSGGVDSTIAAARLVNAGFDVIGITMHLVPIEYKPVSGAQASDERACCSIGAVEDARRMANTLGIPHYVLNLSDQFEEKVMAPSRLEYSRGRTPNPCVLCNRYMKFDILFHRAEQLGCEYVATGHYARITNDHSGLHLLRGVDKTKDQTYFLAYLTANEAARIIFPLGDDTKESIRKEASEMGLKVADRPESQDLCFFATDPPSEALLSDGRDGISGEIITTSGDVVGYHRGISGFTIGQRKGVPGGMPEKMFVVEIDTEHNRVIVGVGDECFSNEFSVDDISVLDEVRDKSRFEKSVEVQVRYRTRPVGCRVYFSDNKNAKVQLIEPVRAVTPGQTAVWYDGDEVLGAGTIKEIFRLER